MTAEKRAYIDWKVKAIRMIMNAQHSENIGGKLNRGYCAYIKKFFFGDSEWHDLECDTWNSRKQNRELPMSWTEWYVG